MDSRLHGGRQSQTQSPAPRATPRTSAHTSPANSILLPPAEIEASPAYSPSTRRTGQHHHHQHQHHQHHHHQHHSRPSSDSTRDGEESDERNNARQAHDFDSEKGLSKTPPALSFSRKEDAMAGSSEMDAFEGDYLDNRVQARTLRRSASNMSITIKKRGCFGRLRRSPNFILFTVFLALFVDMATYGIIVPILPFIVSDKINGGATDTGLLLAVYAVGILLSSPLFGVLGDYFVSRRTPMLIGLVGMLISTVLFMLATNFYVFLLARLLQGVAGGSVWTLGLALITDVFPANTLGAQMGKALVGYTLGLMMGPPLGGILYERGGYRAPFLFCCIITLIDFACRALIVEEREEIVRALRNQGMRSEASEEEAEVVALRKRERKDESTSFWNLIKNKRLFGCIIVTACNAFAFSGAEPTVPLHLASTFHLTSERIGLVFMAFSLPTLTAPISGALSDKFGAKSICLVSLVICGCSIGAAGLSQYSLPMIVFLFTIIGTTGTAFLTPVLGELSAVVRTTGTGDGFARAYAMFNMAFSLGVLIGPVVCGIVYEHFGFTALSLTMAGVLFLGIPVVILCLGGADQKKRDLAQYKEEEDRRANARHQLTRSKYSIEFTNQGQEELGMRLSPGEDALAEKHAGEDKDVIGGRGLVGMSGSREEILKTARMD